MAEIVKSALKKAETSETLVTAPDGSCQSPNELSSVMVKSNHLSRPIFMDISDTPTSSKGSGSAKTPLDSTVQSDDCAINNIKKKPRSMRFSMEFIYPSVDKRSNKAYQNFVTIEEDGASCSDAFDDNFASLNLTQMLEDTAALVDKDLPVGTGSEPTTGASESLSRSECLPIECNVSEDLTLHREDTSTKLPATVVTNVDLRENSCTISANGTLHVSNARQLQSVQLDTVVGMDRPKNLGLPTAAGMALTAPSGESLARARRLIQQCQNQVLVPASSSVEAGGPDKSLKTATPSDSPMFTKTAERGYAAEGVTTKPSMELQIEPKTVGGSAHLNVNRGFQTAAGRALKTPSSESLARAKRLLQDIEEPINESVGFQIAADGSLSNPFTESLVCASKALQECKETSKNMDVASSARKPDKINTIQHENQSPNCNQCTSPLFNSEVASKPATGVVSETVSNENKSQFLKPQEKPILKLASEACRPVNPAASPVLNFDCRSNPASEEESATPLESPKQSSDSHPFRSHGFKTANGEALKTPSRESLLRARRLFQECEDSVENVSSPLGSKPTAPLVLNPRPTSTGAVKVPLQPLKPLKESTKSSVAVTGPALNYGCQPSAVGALATPSPEPLKDRKQLLQERNESAEDLSMQAVGKFGAFRGFTTASGGALKTPSRGALLHARRLIDDSTEVANDPILNKGELESVGKNNLILPPNLASGSRVVSFTSGDGKPLPAVSVESIKRAKLLLENEVELDNTSPQNEVVSASEQLTSILTRQQDQTTLVDFTLGPESAVNTTRGKSPSLELSSDGDSPEAKENCAMSPNLDFDGSFEISSQMMSVIDGNVPPPSPKFGSSDVEEQRVKLRSEQALKAETCFKSTSRPTSSTSSINSSHAGASSKPRKVNQEPLNPGILWKHRKLGIRPNRLDAEFSASHSGEEFTFLDDSLQLEGSDQLSINTAGSLRFRLDADDGGPSYRLGDDVDVIPDSSGYAGCAEVVRAFVCSPGVTKGLASYQWICHHFAQLAWRLGSVVLMHHKFVAETVFPHLSLPDASIHRTNGRLLLHILLLELKYRYDRELEAVQRPAIRKILERDDTPAKRITLCVSHLEKISANQYRGRLTDGWYHVDWIPDILLTRLINSGRIRVGTKLVTVGALLVQSPSGFGGGSSAVTTTNVEDAHLFGESSNGLALRLNGNSTRQAHPRAKLGFVNRRPITQLPPIPLSSISADGGLVSSVCVLIQRRFQVQYMETCAADDSGASDGDGGRKQFMFRDPRSEQVAERKHAEKCQLAFDRAVEAFNSSKRERGSRVQPKAPFLASLGLDGEALWRAVSGALDPDLAESDISPAQRDAMLRYRETAMQDLFAQFISKREVTKIMRLQVAGIHPLDVEKRTELPLTLWSPSEEMLDVFREGAVVELTRLQVATTRPTDPFASCGCSAESTRQILTLSAGRGTKFRVLKPTERIKFYKHSNFRSSTTVQELVDSVYRPRNFLSVGDLRNIKTHPSNQQQSRVVDFSALVVGTKKAPGPCGSGYAGGREKSDLSLVYLASLRGEDGAEDFSTLAVLRVWGGLERYSLGSVLTKKNRVRFTDIQVRSCSRLQVDADFPPEGSPEVACVLLNYSAASYVSTETVSRDVVNRRFHTPWKETPRFFSYMQTCMEAHFERFFSPASTSMRSTRQSSFSTSLGNQTPADRSCVSSLAPGPRGRGNLLASANTHETPTASPSPAPLARSRTRAGLGRPRKSTPVQQNPITPLNPSRHSTPAACSTPIATKRPFTEAFGDETAISPFPTISSQEGSNAKRELELFEQVESPKSPQFNFPTTELDTFVEDPPAEENPGSQSRDLSFSDASSLDVSIADLVKTRKRGRGNASQDSTTAEAAPKKRALKLKDVNW